MAIAADRALGRVHLNRAIPQAIRRRQFAVDDFGRGYSSLAYLKDYPFDALKIDRSFIEDITTNVDSRAIVKLIIGLAATLNLHSVAEGIETDDQRSILADLGCHRGQGFLVAPALTRDELVATLANQ